ncbi:hypothetical protein TWF481_004289 [Arthrobotrys musiformis]|uniref:Histone chaperone domain-containing protein n=1 Tax=Arthrobotrys musiformis TaxID=47236 RepID=A0AAV9WJ31_9PEZI
MSTYDDAMDTTPDKGKGKLQDDSIANPTEEDSSEEEEEETFDEHTLPEDEVEHDTLETINTENIVSGGRTRTKAPINYAEVDQTGLDDDDDEDDDFQEKPAQDDEDPDRMEQ